MLTRNKLTIRLMFILVTDCFASGITTATLNILARLEAAIHIDVEVQGNGTSSNNIVDNTLNNAPPILSTSANIMVQCVGNVALSLNVNSNNDFKLISRDNPTIQVPYSVQTGNVTFSNPEQLNFICNNKSTIVPVYIQSRTLPVNYTTGAYQDNLLFIVTY